MGDNPNEEEILSPNEPNPEKAVKDLVSFLPRRRSLNPIDVPRSRAGPWIGWRLIALHSLSTTVSYSP
jgi:hypothetical protein